MKKLLAIFLISLFVFQVSYCQENGEELVEEVEAEMESEIEEQAADKEWTPLDVDLAESNTTLAFYYSLGAQWVISETIGNHEISNSTWVVTVLHDLSKKVDDEQYKYNVSFQDIGNLDDTFQAEYVIGKDRFSTTGIRSWTTYILGDYTDNDGNTVKRVMKSAHQYENDTAINQFLDPETLEPTSDPAAITSWNNIPYNQWKDDATINDVGKKAAESAIQKALDTEILSAGDWKVNYVTPATLPEYGGDVYYRFTFALYDASGFLIANGNAYAIKDSEGNFENLTSGIGSLSVSA